MRAEFDEYIGAVPASRIDLDGLVRQGRQMRRRRRATVVGLATLMVLVTLLTAGTAALRRQAGLPTGTVSTTPSPQRSLDTTERLIAAFVAAMNREAPEVSGAETIHRYLRSCPPETPGQATPNTTPCHPADAERLNGFLYEFRGQLSTPTAHCDLNLKLSRQKYYDPSGSPENEIDASERAAAAALGYAPQRGPSGEAIYWLSDGSMRMTRPDGTGVWFTCGRPAPGAGPVFTSEQVLAIGRAPDLHF